MISRLGIYQYASSSQYSRMPGLADIVILWINEWKGSRQAHGERRRKMHPWDGQNSHATHRQLMVVGRRICLIENETITTDVSVASEHASANTGNGEILMNTVN